MLQNGEGLQYRVDGYDEYIGSENIVVKKIINYILVNILIREQNTA